MNRIHGALGLVLVAAGAVAMVGAKRPAADRRPGHAGPTGSEEAAPDVPPFAASEEAERARVYDLSFAQELSPEQGAPTRLALRARVEIASRDAAGRDLVRLTSAVTEGDSLPAASELETVFARLHDGEGRLEALAFRAGTSREARTLLKALAGALQYTGPRDVAAGEWRANELDVGGRFASRYRRVDATHVVRVERRFLGAPDQTTPGMGIKVAGTTGFAFDEDGALRALQTDERADLSAADVWRLRARLAVSLSRVGDAPAGWRVPFAGLEREGLVVVGEVKSPSSADDRARLGGRSLADLREQARLVEGLARSMDRARARAELQLDVGALVRLRPSTAVEIAERLKDAATPAAEVTLLAGSLVAAGTLDASHALGEVLGESTRGDVRTQAALSLNVTKAHDAETIDALGKGMADADPDVASTSALALGSASRALRASGGSIEEAVRLLAASYREAATVEARIAAVRAAGNSGDSSLLPLVEEALRDHDVDLQAAAAYALRFMDASAEPLLARALTTSLLEVRHAAVRAVAVRTLSIASLQPALQTALAMERDEDVRAVLAVLLTRAA